MINCKYNLFGEFNDEHKVGPAKWPHFDLIFIHEGYLLLWPDDDKKLELKTGQAVLIYPNTSFWGYSLVENTRVSVNHFEIVPQASQAAKVVEVLSGRENGYQFFPESSGRQIERDIERLINAAHSDDDDYSQDITNAMMLVILAGLFKALEASVPVKGDATFDELLRFMNENLSRDISLEEMAAVTGFSVSHFRALFKKRFFETPGAYFQKLRLSTAARRLRETTQPIKSVARQSGYDTLPNFYRAFVNVFCMTPGEYRKLNLPTG